MLDGKWLLVNRDSDNYRQLIENLPDTKTYFGTGIGLSIVSRIISHHDGEIWVDGELGQGACFYFTLP